MINIIKNISNVFSKCKIFRNIAEGTHEGTISLTAGIDIPSANLVVKEGETEGEFLIAGVGDRPLGICTDEGTKGDRLAVILTGSAESSAMCVASSSVNAGDQLYGAANGKVSTVAENGAFRIGTAICSAASGGIVEVDTNGFGTRAWQFHSAGIFSWNGGAATTANLAVDGLTKDDLVIANLSAIGGSEKNVTATVDANGDKINFKLDANGTNETTKISWIAVSKK